MTSNLKQTLGIVIFSIGVLFGLSIGGSAVWADFEASLFAPAINARGSLRSLSCPIVITSADEASASAEVDNPSDRDKIFLIRTNITDGYVTLFKEIDTKLELDAGESKLLKWPINLQDAAWGRVVMMRVYISRNYPVPDRDATCGILIANTSLFKGWHLLTGALVLTVAAMGSGLWIWYTEIRSLKNKMQYSVYALFVLGILTLLIIFLSLIGLWTISGLLLGITLLLIISILTTFSTH